MRQLGTLAIVVAVGVLVPASANASTGAQLWATAGCGGCHTLAAAGSNGQVGPDLDVLRPSASRIARQITDGGAAMPSFSGTLSSAEIQTLATWVASVAGGGAGTAGAATPASSSTSPGVGAPSAAGPGAVLAGMTVAAVRRLQAELARLGYFHHVVTGYYGPVTTGAVKAFQRSVGLKPDGIWGPRTQASLKRRLG